MSQLSVQTQSSSLLQNKNIEQHTTTKITKQKDIVVGQNNVAKTSPKINFKALGINHNRYDQAALNALTHSPDAITKLANYQLNRLKKAQDREKKIKTSKWNIAKHSAKITDTEYKNAVQGLINSHSDEFKRTKKELEEIIETVQKNRQVQEGEIIKNSGLESSETDKKIKNLSKLDEVATKKCVKDLPDLDPKPKTSFAKRLFSKSGLAILATALVGAAAVAVGVTALPALGIAAAVGLTAEVAVPSIYSTISSFIAVIHPKTKATSKI